jgi:exopolysaccharide biosynthesis polyprenyl glycosylphosphotransferase
MSKRLESIILLLLDFVSINLAYGLYFLFRVRSGWINVFMEPEFWLPLLLIWIYWVAIFFMVGLYRSWYAASRFDELALVFKSLALGCLFLFFVVFMDDQSQHSVQVSSRMLIGMYFSILVVCVSTGRLALRAVQRRMLINGVGTRNTVIVGSPEKSRLLYDQVVQYPALGYRVLGYVGIANGKVSEDLPAPAKLGYLESLDSIIPNHDIREVLIALDSSDHGRLLEVIAKCNAFPVGMKIMPDLYDIISGQARTNAIYGFPLIEISPQLMTPWEESLKRILDVTVSLLILIIGFPIWLLVALIIRLESRGPALYKQERVGKDGARFNMIKFRSMRQDAEKGGPQWAHKKDPRVTRVGKWLRKLHIDEVPQMFNVLSGHMSLVGPRPERPMFVESLSKEIPLYTRRLKVRPGVTGWAQVKHQYDETIEDVKKKVQYDLYYIENMSLRMDMKILFSTASHMLLGKGR